METEATRNPSYCPGGGKSLQAGAWFGSFCATPAAPIQDAQAAALPPSSAAVTSPGPEFRPKRSHARLWALVISVVVVVTVLLVLFVGPIPHSFSATIAATCETCNRLYPGSAVINPPKGSSVSGTYSSIGCGPIVAPPGGVRCLTIDDVLQDTVYTGLGSFGSFSFTSQHPPYTFIADNNGTVTVSGAISYPLL